MGGRGNGGDLRICEACRIGFVKDAQLLQLPFAVEGVNLISGLLQLVIANIENLF